MKKILVFLLILNSQFSILNFLYAQNDRGFEISKNLEIFANVYKTLNANYVDDVDPGKAIKTAIDAMLASMDPYTNYFPESDMEDVKMQMLGQYGGIGSLIHQEGDKHYIAEPFEGMPADLAGLKAGDRILAVNGESTEGKKTTDVSNAMRGQAGTTVTLSLERDGKTFDVTLTRKEIHMPNVPYSGMVAGDIGYIRLTEFTQDAAKNVREAFVNLKRANPGMKGIILDLRGNGGGLMNEAIDIVNIWVKSGELVVEQKGKVASRNQKHRTTHAPEDLNIPVAVLINEHSASASEIVSGSLQDLDRAVIIGERSFGKGLVQNILPMPYNNQMKVTVSKYYIPSGRCIQAIDYSRRDENGRAVKVPDSLKTAFKTRNGRTVYDGFGIEPDIEVEIAPSSLLTVALYNKFLFFQYANKYVKEHPTIPSAGDFRVTDEIYQDFVSFLSDKDYEYTTYTERLFEELHRVAKDENYIDEINNQLDQLEATFKNAKKDDLMRNREDISRYLRDEILVRYYYQKGRIEGSLVDDPDVLKAIEVLTHPDQYNALLKGEK
ncbi:MAG: S41 family peptidase [Bacteroidales bacterium]|nr:S41 family peptidase [Bacteroidales bacterium]